MILLVAEHNGTKLARSAYELTTAARSLSTESPLAILILGHNIAPVAAEAARLAGPDGQVLVADLPALAAYDPELWSAAVAQIAAEGEAHTILIAASRSGRDYSPRVAIKLDAALLEDVIALSQAGTTLEAAHYTHLSRVTERLASTATITVATIKPGAFLPATPGTTEAEQYDVELTLPSPRLQVTARTTEKSERVALAEADIVVAGGRGLGSAEAFDQLIVPLADKLGAAIAATRAVVDAGWRPYAEQVGQTGKTVQPKAYIAIGISGAVQHISGMGKSKLIIAINRDPDAPIFKEADFGLIGDVKAIVPAILEELESSER